MSLIHEEQAQLCSVLQTWLHHAWWCPILFPNLMQILEHNQQDVIHWCDSLKWFCTWSQNVANFCWFLITESFDTWRNEQHNCHSSFTTIFFPFLAFNCECARSSVVADVSTMFNDIILRVMTLEMCSSGTPQSISNVEVGRRFLAKLWWYLVCKHNDRVPS